MCIGTFIDLSGRRYGRLTVTDRAENTIASNGRSVVMWNCICDCGNSTVASRSSLQSGKKKSCGCLLRENSAESMRKIANKYPHAHPTHGESKDRLFNIWYLMIYRCENQNTKCYKNYGGRGIKVCPEWNNGIEGYREFKKWAISNGYSESLSIDRIDVDADYTPSNCRWANAKTQSNNTRRNRIVTWNGESHTVAEWADIIGVPMKVLHARLFKIKWSVERAMTTPYKDKRVYIQLNGVTKTITEWANEIGITESSLSKRIKNGWDIEKALTTPPVRNQTEQQNF